MVQPLAGWWREGGWMGSHQVALRELERKAFPEISLNLSVRWGWKVPTPCRSLDSGRQKVGNYFCIVVGFFFFKQGLCKLFLYSLEPVLHKQRAMKTSEDTRCKEDVSETERRTLLNTVFGEWSELKCTPRALKVTAQTVCLSSLRPVLFLRYTGQHLRPRAWL